MGEAFDRDNNLLGSATGATKAEVFDKLSKAHGDADRIEIRTMHYAETAAQLETTALESGERMLKYFSFKHLPPALQETSAGFARLACDIVQTVSSSAERTAGLRKLLEAKDCIVRARLE